MTNKYIEKIGQQNYGQPQKKKKSQVPGMLAAGTVAAGGGLAGMKAGESIGKSIGKKSVPKVELDMDKVNARNKQVAARYTQAKKSKHQRMMAETKGQINRKTRTTIDRGAGPKSVVAKRGKTIREGNVLKDKLKEGRVASTAEQRKLKSKAGQRELSNKLRDRAISKAEARGKPARKAAGKAGKAVGGRVGGLIGLGLAGAAGFSALTGD